MTTAAPPLPAVADSAASADSVPASGLYTRYRLEFTAVRRMVPAPKWGIELTTIHLFCAGRLVIPLQVLNPGGKNPRGGFSRGEYPRNLLDPDLKRKWMDYAFTENGRSVLEFEFPQEQAIDKYVLVTGDCVDNRDPTAWVLSGFNENIQAWVKIDERTDITPPDSRFTSYAPCALFSTAHCSRSSILVLSALASATPSYRLEFTAVRQGVSTLSSCGGIQLSGVQMFYQGRQVRPLKVTNPGGKNPDGPIFRLTSGDGQIPMNLLDPDPSRKWMDYAWGKKKTGRSVLEFTFPQEQAVDKYVLVAADSLDNRDPTAWTLSHREQADKPWVVIDERSGISPPSSRITPYTPFSVHQTDKSMPPRTDSKLQQQTVQQHHLEYERAPLCHHHHHVYNTYRSWATWGLVRLQRHRRASWTPWHP